MLPALKLAFALVRLGLAGALLYGAFQFRTPLLASIRPLALAILVAAPLVLIAVELAAWRFRGSSRWAAATGIAAGVVAVAALGATIAFEFQFRSARQEVLRADPALLEKLGRHFIVGYRRESELRELIERRAIAGVFVSAANVRGKDADTIRREIDGFQAIRRREHLPPLLIATDQEGGAVSRMSPPLPRPAALGDVVRSQGDEDERRKAVRTLASDMGRLLAGLGFNLNFAPVIDLDQGVVDPGDRYTRIGSRVISADPNVVSTVAREFCAGLGDAGVHCTLKHFPGLGRVRGDTHVEDVSLGASVATLQQTDWVPFQQLMDQGTFTMLSHVRLTAIDRANPASFSSAVVSGLLRGEWKYDGALVTDDFSMGAVYGSDGGLAGASVSAINAGVDLILISYDPDQLYPAIHALMAAEARGGLNHDKLDQSDRRLARIIADRTTPAAPAR